MSALYCAAGPGPACRRAPRPGKCRHGGPAVAQRATGILHGSVLPSSSRQGEQWPRPVPLVAEGMTVAGLQPGASLAWWHHTSARSGISDGPNARRGLRGQRSWDRQNRRFGTIPRLWGRLSRRDPCSVAAARLAERSGSWHSAGGPGAVGLAWEQPWVAAAVLAAAFFPRSAVPVVPVRAHTFPAARRPLLW